MKSKKAPGPDGILPEIVKSAVMAVPEWVLAVMNKILLNGDFPSMWKRAKVVLLPKPGKPAFQPSSYRLSKCPLYSGVTSSMGYLSPPFIHAIWQRCSFFSISLVLSPPPSS
ncbi:hypothetical protein M8J77_021567 [Diaphorina citri]|nr:hypothetical protein M8J77_021567 [Diaphorina citri]